MVREGVLERNAEQKTVVREFDRLCDELSEQRLARKSSALGWLFGARKKPAPVRGVYVWGSVGRGKTMLMDLFFETVPVQRKRRVHFHEFMAEVHARIHQWRQQKKRNKVSGEDPIGPVAEALAEQAWLLCFDEFIVTDIADAMILGRLFTALFEKGVVIVATSNVEPENLYEGGLNRALFLPFVALLKDRCVVCELDGEKDFRLEKLSGAPVYYVPPDDAARASLDKAFRLVSGAAKGSPVDLEVLGRSVHVPQAHKNVARFHFDDLCVKPLAAVDYLVIAENFHTIVVDGIPVMEQEQRNEAKRFINFVDTLYDNKVKLIASAQAEPPELYKGTSGWEVFEFERTASRLIEMRSESYLALPHGHANSRASGDTTGIVET